MNLTVQYPQTYALIGKIAFYVVAVSMELGCCAGNADKKIQIGE
ncbi:TPA_asm: hypothetical protein vir519_00051 [Caudoviricetes sp. vir519]|nr:TPA_asm: hypothetical protein vir519_00051 [Caudoviricetes sp. vir519]